jgi:hypothetical protein
MKQKFVITPPRPNRSTATLVTHMYNATTKRTATVYLGSFSCHVNPDEIPENADIRPGDCLHGIRLRTNSPFGLKTDDVSRIRVWLEQHGTYRRRVAEERARECQRAEERARERAQLMAELEEEVRKKLEAQKRGELEAASAASAGYALVQAVQAIELAAAELLREAHAAKEAGYRVSNLRSVNTEYLCAANPMDVLQMRANRIRKAAMAVFEEACKDAGVMERRK